MNIKLQTKLTLILLLLELTVGLKVTNLNSSTPFTDSQLEVKTEEEASSASLANQESKSNLNKSVIVKGLNSVQITSGCTKNSMSADLTKIIIKPESRRIRKLKLFYTDRNNQNRTLEILPHFDTNTFTPDLIQINIMRKNKSALQKAVQDGAKEKRFERPENETEFMPVNIITGGNESCVKYIINVNGDAKASNIAPVYNKQDRSLPKSKFIELNKIKGKKRKLPQKVALMSSTVTWSSTSTQVPSTSTFDSTVFPKQVTSNRDQVHVASVKPPMLNKVMGKVPEKSSKLDVHKVKKAKARKASHCPPHVHHHHHYLHHHPYRYHVRQKFARISFTTVEPETTHSTVASDTTSLKWTRKARKTRVTKSKYKLTHPEEPKAKKPIDKYVRRPDQTFYGEPRGEHKTTFKVGYPTEAASTKAAPIDNLNTIIDKMLRDINKSEMKTTETSVEEMTESGQITTTPLDEDVMEIHSDHSPFFFFLLNLQGFKVENGHLVDEEEKGTAFQAVNRIFKHKGHHKKHPKHHK